MKYKNLLENNQSQGYISLKGNERPNVINFTEIKSIKNEKILHLVKELSKRNIKVKPLKNVAIARSGLINTQYTN